MSDDPIAEKPLISAYTRHQAIAHLGVLIDATVGDFSKVTRKHFKHLPVAMTAQVFAIPTDLLFSSQVRPEGVPGRGPGLGGKPTPLPPKPGSAERRFSLAR
jgi:hypothetical protein